ARTEGMIFKDSVIVLHPRFSLAADSLTYDAIVSRVRFNGSTDIYTSTGQIYCESGFYDLSTEEAEFTENARYSGKGKEATAEKITYNSKLEEVRMYGDVEILDHDRLIIGDSVRYHEQNGETWIYGQPAFYSDSNRKLQSPVIFYNEKTKKVSMEGESEMVDGSVILKALKTEFDEKSGL